MFDAKGTLSVKKYVVFLLVLVVSLAFSSLSAAVKMKQIEFWDDSEPTSLIDLDHTPFKDILQKYIVSDHPSGIPRFDYRSVIQSDFIKLQNYLEYLQLMEPRQLNDAESKAYWINLYNAATLELVLQAFANGAVSKIRARGLPARRWRQKIVTISEQAMSLEDILHGVIRPMFKDYRVHYGLFFCALGGPDMPKDVFDGDNNEELLNSLETKYLQHSRAVRVEGDELVLSDMFKSFDTDFAPNQRALIAYLKQKVSEPLSQAMDSISDVRYEYDRTVNAP